MKLSDIFLSRPDLLGDENKLKSVFADYYTGDTAKINRMMKAYEIGILDTLIGDRKTLFERQILIDKLVNQHDMVEEKATDAIEEWNRIVNSQVALAYNNYLAAKEKERKEQQDEILV